MKTEVKKRDNGEVEINITIPNADFLQYWDKGFKSVQDKVEIDGFRKGNAPQDVIISKYGEMAVLEEMANIAIDDSYVKAILENKIAVIDHPHIHIVKLSKADDFVYMAHAPVYPEFTIPDYKAIAKSVKKDEITSPTDEEVENVLKELAKGRGEGTAIDDAFAQTFGKDQFPTIESLRHKVRENLSLEKAQTIKEKNRAAILEELIKSTEVTIPPVMIGDETNRIIGQMKFDVGRMGGNWSEYLTHTGKTEEDMRKEYEDIAKKRATSQLLLNEIAKAENIKPSDDEVDVEVIRIMAQDQNAKEDNVKAYVTNMLMNEKVLQLLETQ